MKKFTILAIFVAMIMSTSAQYKMQIWVNGYNVIYDVSTVDSVVFIDETPKKLFSIAEDKTVCFSPGNLQFNATKGSHLRADGTIAKGTWRFAENQWDCIGEANQNIAETYDGWIDLFGWGTSGYDNTANDTLAIFYQPWSYSTTDLSSIPIDSTLNCDAYEITGECEWEYIYYDNTHNTYGYGPSTNMLDANLVGTSAYYDWGVYNAISNGGNSPGLWRTLTNTEWEYLLNTRKNAQFLRSQATVNGVYGYVILPDDFKKPADVTWKYQTNEWSTNTYTIEQWKKLEAVGAIFLPLAGERQGTSIYDLYHRTFYWTVNSDGHSFGALALYFCLTEARLTDYDARYSGRCVRLVKDL